MAKLTVAASLLFLSSGVTAEESLSIMAEGIRLPEKADRACQRETGSFVLSSQPCHQLAATLQRIRAREEIYRILDDNSWYETMLAQASSVDVSGSE